jgi:uncharacterized membrane protein
LDFNMPMSVGRYIPCFLGFVSIIPFFTQLHVEYRSIDRSQLQGVWM